MTHGYSGPLRPLFRTIQVEAICLKFAAADARCEPGDASSADSVAVRPVNRMSCSSSDALSAIAVADPPVTFLPKRAAERLGCSDAVTTETGGALVKPPAITPAMDHICDISPFLSPSPDARFPSRSTMVRPCSLSICAWLPWRSH